MVATDNAFSGGLTNKGNLFPNLVHRRSETLSVVSSKRNNFVSQTYSRQIQHLGGLPFKDVETHLDRVLNQTKYF